jgi:hypothetical protein
VGRTGSSNEGKRNTQPKNKNKDKNLTTRAGEKRNNKPEAEVPKVGYKTSLTGNIVSYEKVSLMKR